jgi:hypothetical protein
MLPESIREIKAMMTRKKKPGQDDPNRFDCWAHLLTALAALVAALSPIILRLLP